jgi:DNA-binding response OmpR family regulator
VMLDVDMPGMDGFETLSALKSDDAVKRIPVVMVTGKNQGSEVLRGLRLGAKEYILKPFNLMNVLERILQVRTQKLPPA